jgi:serine/threonine-protein kinase
LGRYEIQSALGWGMMGVVYKAWDPLLGRPVALKILRLDFPMREDERQLMEQRFLREASLAAALSHPNIVVVHDVGRDPDTNTPFIALEYLEGRTLAEIASPMRLDWRDALRLTARLAQALHHAHGHGVIHRDIKPSNVMVLPTGEPKILDFGIARASAGQLTAAGEAWGTPSFMSPEQATASAVDGRSDLFSLGSVLYELLTGRRAFAADGVAQVMARVVREQPPLPTSADPTLPPGVDTIMARALAKDPGERYPDGQAFAEDVEDVIQGRPVRARTGLRAAAALAPRDPVSQAGDAWDAASCTLTTRIPGRRSALARHVSRRLREWGPGVVLGAALAVAVMLVPATPLPVAPPAAATTGPAFWEAAAPWTPVAVAGSPAAPVVEPAHVALSVEHAFKRGQLKVWVDDRLVLDKALASTQTRRLLFLKRRKGSFAEVLEVLPGERRLRLEVVADGARRSAELRGVFKSDETRLLEVKLGGKVELEWKS